MSVWLTAILPMIGVMIGAILQYWFSRATEDHKNQQTLRTQAYVDYVRGVTGITFAQRVNNKEKEQESLILLVDAQARILMYGLKPVIQSLAEFYRKGKVLDTPERREDFITLCRNMRRDSLPRTDADLDYQEALVVLFTE